MTESNQSLSAKPGGALPTQLQQQLRCFVHISNYYEYLYFKKIAQKTTQNIPHAFTSAWFNPCTSSRIFPGGSSIINFYGLITAQVRPIQSNRSAFSLNKKAHAVERRRAVSQDGAVGPFFEGNMPLQKKHPKKWLGTPSHSLNAVKYCQLDDHCGG